MEITQYSIVIVNLDPTVGSEIKKTRPCVVISPDEMNRYLHTITLAPMTTQSRKYPTRVEVKFQEKSGWIILDQIRTVDRQRLIKILGKLSDKEILAVKNIIRNICGLEQQCHLVLMNHQPSTNDSMCCNL
ncbi:MAG: type II toxin-antitoxin system PemK/MazF family toxin [Bacteroidales bacterium]|nr:type II toxin-antitoxin system PemK/MazF family toxin [Bacteroidales bacterium]